MKTSSTFGGIAPWFRNAGLKGSIKVKLSRGAPQAAMCNDLRECVNLRKRTAVSIGHLFLLLPNRQILYISTGCCLKRSIAIS